MKQKLYILFVIAGAILFSGDNGLRPEKHECQAYKSSLHFSNAQIGEEREDVFQYDAQRYELDLTIQSSTPKVAGSVTMTATSKLANLSQIVVHLSNYLSVSNISGVSNYSHSGGRISINLGGVYQIGEEFTFTITYSGNPQNGAGFWSTWQSGASHFYTLSEPYEARNWWPCKDFPSDKANSAEIRFTVSDDIIAVSNGALTDLIENGNGTHTFVWEENHPITTYLISLAAGNYITIQDETTSVNGDVIPLEYWIFESESENSTVINSIEEVPDMIECFETGFGAYPFTDEKYGMASFGWGGGMEHQTVSSMGSYSNYIVAHELGHQWWGDMITCRTFNHIWLNEGFASYSEALWRECKMGVDSYHSYMGNMDGGSNGFDGPIFIADTSNFWNIFSIIVYDKGAWVLHMLRHVMGDDDFFAGLSHYYDLYQYSTAVTEDLSAAMSDIYGSDLSWFFDEWIYGERRPKYFYWTFWKESAGGFEIDFNLQQIQSDTETFFTMPVDIGFSDGAQESIASVFNDQSPQMFVISTDFLPTEIQIDPDDWILNEVSTSDYFFHEGDVNMDNAVNILDVMRTVSIVIDTGNEPTRFELSAADYSNDALVDVIDVIQMVNYILAK